MVAVTAQHHGEFAVRSMSQRNVDTTVALDKSGNRLFKGDLDTAADPAEQDLQQGIALDFVSVGRAVLMGGLRWQVDDNRVGRCSELRRSGRNAIRFYDPENSHPVNYGDGAVPMSTGVPPFRKPFAI